MKDLIKLVRGNTVAMVGVVILSAFLFIALAAPLITSHAPDKRTVIHMNIHHLS